MDLPEAPGSQQMAKGPQLPLQCGGKLCGHQIGGKVTGEIAHIARSPLDILKDALPVIPGCDSQIIGIFLSPHLWQLRHRQRSADQILLHLIAYEDMENIGQLIGIVPDQRGTDLIDRLKERLPLAHSQ